MRTDDEAEFTAMVERQGRFVVRIAYSLLRNPEDAEDVVQEMLLNLYRRRAWTGLRDERAFLARAVWRTAVDKLRQRRPGGAQGQDVSEAIEMDVAALAPDPEWVAIGMDWQERVHALVDALPEKLRQPLALSTVEKMNSREIGEVMGIAEGTVRTRLMRARQLLREKVAATAAAHRAGEPHARLRPQCPVRNPAVRRPRCRTFFTYPHRRGADAHWRLNRSRTATSVENGSIHP